MPPNKEDVKYIISMQDKMSKQLDVLMSKTNKADKKVMSFGKTIAGLAGIGGGVMAIRALVRGMAQVISAGADFGAEMSNVQALTNATGEEFLKLEEKAKQLGETTQFSAKQAAEGMSFLAMAGFESNEIMDAMPGVLNLAAVGGIELGQAADIASNALSAYGLEANKIGKVNDIIAKTITSANTNLTMFAESFKYVAPIAKGVDVQIEELSASIGILGNAGIQSSMAGTTLRQAIANMITPSGQKKLKQYGITAMTATGSLRPLADIIEDINKKGLQTADVMALFGMRAGPGMQVLIDSGAEALRQFTKELENSAGTADRIASQKLDNLKGDTVEFRSAMEGLKITLEKKFDPQLRKTVKMFTRMTRGLNDVLKPQKELSELVTLENVQFNRQISILKDANLSQDARKKLISQINEQYKEYLPSLLTEKSTLKDIEAAQLEANKQFRIGIIQRALRKELTDMAEADLIIKNQQVENEIKYASLLHDSVMMSKDQIEHIKFQRTLSDGLTDGLSEQLSTQEQIEDKYKRIAERYGILFRELNAQLQQPGTKTLETQITGADKVAGAVQKITSAAPRIFNINIDTLVENINNNVTTLKEGMAQSKQVVVEALMDALNQTQVIAHR